MLTEFKYAMRRLRGAIIGWSFGMTLYGLLMGYFYSSVKEMADEFERVMDIYPEEFMNFFRGMDSFGSPLGYLDTYFFSMMGIILGIFAVSKCANMLVKDEEKGILDLTIAHPITRTNLFWSRLAAFIVSLTIIMVVIIISWWIPSESSGLNITLSEYFVSMSTLYFLMLIYGTLALVLSMFLPSSGMAVGISMAVVVGNFLLEGMAGFEDILQTIYEFTPMNFYQGAQAIVDFKPEYLVGLGAVSLVFVLIAWWRFEKREIRVGGEGGWQIPLPAFLKRS